jgi:ubiquinone/menaquinone biosynthesis C-methylase UbiE
VAENLDQTFEAALAFDAAIVPRYARHFGERLLGALRLGPKPHILDLACRTGYPTQSILDRARDGRIIALDRDAKFIELARARIGADVGRKVFFKHWAPPELRFGAEVFTHAVCNLFDRVTTDYTALFSEVYRVLSPGGQFVFTMPLQGSCVEVFDMLREVAIRHDLKKLSERIEQQTLAVPTAKDLKEDLVVSGFAHVEVSPWSFELDYPSSREMFDDPVTQQLMLPDWRSCAEAAPDADMVLQQVREALDTYFQKTTLNLTIVGCVATATRV